MQDESKLLDGEFCSVFTFSDDCYLSSYIMHLSSFVQQILSSHGTESGERGYALSKKSFLDLQNPLCSISESLLLAAPFDAEDVGSCHV